jgi:hypothetical protein
MNIEQLKEEADFAIKHKLASMAKVKPEDILELIADLGNAQAARHAAAGYRMMPVKLHPSIKDALVETGKCFQPEHVWASIIEAFDRVATQEPAPIQSGELAELRKLAEAATPGEWLYDENMSPFREAGGEIVGGDGLGHADVYTAYDVPCPIGEQDDDFPAEPRTITEKVALPDARFIAAANPAAILRLLAALAAPTPPQAHALTDAAREVTPMFLLNVALCIEDHDLVATSMKREILAKLHRIAEAMQAERMAHLSPMPLPNGSTEEKEGRL